MMERLKGILGGAISAAGAFVSSLCCVLPVAVVLLGVGSGAFMATTMKYTAIFVPIGVLSVSAGICLHVRERRRCAREGCAMSGRPLNLILLTFSGLVVAAALFFTIFPGLSSEALLWATSARDAQAPATMDMPTGSAR